MRALIWGFENFLSKIFGKYLFLELMFFLGFFWTEINIIICLRILGFKGFPSPSISPFSRGSTVCCRISLSFPELCRWAHPELCRRVHPELVEGGRVRSVPIPSPKGEARRGLSGGGQEGAPQ